MVCIDSAEENIDPALALHSEHATDEGWNGSGRPVASADAFGDFLRAGLPMIREGLGADTKSTTLAWVYLDSEGGEPEVITMPGTNASGDTLYRPTVAVGGDLSRTRVLNPGGGWWSWITGHVFESRRNSWTFLKSLCSVKALLQYEPQRLNRGHRGRQEVVG